MENALPIAAIMGPIYLVFGLSVLFYVPSWLKITKNWADNHYVLLPWAFTSLVLGLTVTNLYNVWNWDVWLIVTVTGWLLLLKPVFYLLAPGDWTKKCVHHCATTNWMYFWSLVMIVAGAVLSYYVYLV
ncbi:MAG: hypothetical protein V1908_04745 [Candidatus Peregrinibacteria bacterium]